MRIAGRELAPELLEQLKLEALSLSRRQLARRLCREPGWLSPSGRPSLMSARKALARLTRAGLLPPPLHPPPPRRIQFRGPSADPTPIAMPLDQLQPLEIILLPQGRSALSSQWNCLLDRFHYLGAGPLCGAQLRYLIRGAHGEILAALAFSAAAWKLAGRDQWIGWSPEARLQNLHQIVNNSRCLIPPHVHVPNLASHLLSQVLARLQEDWRARYGYAPVLVETFVEHGRFNGGSYRAANWRAIGLTQGRGRQDRGHRKPCPRRTVWVYPLQPDFRDVLRETSPTPRLAPLPPPPPSPLPPPPLDWAEEEFGHARLGDRRLVRRGCELARAFYARPQAQVPQSCGSRAKTKAAYRFFDNPRVTMPALLKSHYAATTARVAAEPVVLAVQDTTSLNYSAHPATEMLGLIGTEVEGPIGMHVHSTLAFNLAGTPLGLLDVQSWTRDPESLGKKHLRYELPFEQKESVRWLRSLEALERVQPQCPNTRLVSVGDREADIYELFVWATEKENRPALLIRAERCRALTKEQGDLWTHVKGLPAAGEMDVGVPRRGNRAGRTARLEIRFAEVEIKAPKRKAAMGSVRVRAVLAREVETPAGIEPLEWMLLTTLEVENLDQAVEKLRWYAGRWGIEVFHRVLKSGCQIETRQLGGADRIEACLVIDLVVAWRIFHLTKLGRETPDVPCTVYFQDHEWKALMVFVTRCRNLPSKTPTLREVVRMMARLGGFLGRKGDGEPGTQVLWLGIQRLDDIAEMYLAMCVPQLPAPTVSSHRQYG
jgi:hypothetical protein